MQVSKPVLVKDAAKTQRVTLRLNKVSEQVKNAELKHVRVVLRRTTKKSLALNSAPTTLVPTQPAAVAVPPSTQLDVAAEVQKAKEVKLQKLQAAKRFYGNHLPPLACNNCTMQRSCPKYKVGYECAFLPLLNAHRVDNESDLVHYMKELVGASMKRSHLMLLQEIAQGGKPSLETTEALNIGFEQLVKLGEMMRETKTEEFEISGEPTTIIGQLFGRLVPTMEDTASMAEEDIDHLMSKKGHSLPSPGPESDAALPAPADSAGVVAELIKEFVTEDSDSIAKAPSGLSVSEPAEVAYHPSAKAVTGTGKPMPEVEVSSS